MEGDVNVIVADGFTGNIALKTAEGTSNFIIAELKKEGYEYNNNYDIINVPNITHITYGRDVGYKIEQEHFDKDIEEISAAKIREKLLDENSDTG